MLALPESYRVRAELASIGIAKTPIIESNSTQMLTELALNDIGIVFGPDEYMHKDLVKLNVPGVKPIKCYVAMVYNKEIANKAGSAFIGMVKKGFGIS